MKGLVKKAIHGLYRLEDKRQAPTKRQETQVKTTAKKQTAKVADKNQKTQVQETKVQGAAKIQEAKADGAVKSQEAPKNEIVALCEVKSTPKPATIATQVVSVNTPHFEFFVQTMEFDSSSDDDDEPDPTPAQVQSTLLVPSTGFAQVRKPAIASQEARRSLPAPPNSPTSAKHSVSNCIRTTIPATKPTVEVAAIAAHTALPPPPPTTLPSSIAPKPMAVLPPPTALPSIAAKPMVVPPTAIAVQPTVFPSIAGQSKTLQAVVSPIVTQENMAALLQILDQKLPTVNKTNFVKEPTTVVNVETTSEPIVPTAAAAAAPAAAAAAKAKEQTNPLLEAMHQLRKSMV